MRLKIIYTILILLFTGISHAELPCYEISPKKARPKVICCEGSVPGVVDEHNFSFTSIRDMKKRALGRSKIKKAQELGRYLIEAKPVCKSLGLPGDSTPTPIFTNTPGPSPTATPVVSNENFDSEGNVTETGKECFQIPTALSANALRGSQEVSNRCVTCHGQSLLDVPNTVLFDRAMPFVRDRTRVSPMNFDEQSLPDEVLADITAFLNRFRPVNCQ